GVKIREEFPDGQRLALELLVIQAYAVLCAGELSNLAGKELAELDQVCAVALHRVIGEMLFVAQVIQELSNQRAEVLFLRNGFCRSGGGAHRYRLEAKCKPLLFATGRRSGWPRRR